MKLTNNPYQVVKDFEAALCEYTGAPYAVTVTSCTMALLLACQFRMPLVPSGRINIPSRTYLSVPQSIIHAGGKPTFRDELWEGCYEMQPTNVWDSARWFTSGLFHRMGRKEVEHKYICTSFHWTKTLAIGQGGAILHNDPVADKWFRKARFDGRTEGVAPKNDTLTGIGHHCYMSPRDAADGLSRLSVLPEDNKPLPNDDYPNLSAMEVFR